MNEYYAKTNKIKHGKKTEYRFFKGFLKQPVLQIKRGRGEEKKPNTKLKTTDFAHTSN